MVEQEDLARSAHEWTDGVGLPGVVDAAQQEVRPSKRRRSEPNDDITIKFDSEFGAFERTISKTLSSNDLYRLAFRGLKARYTTFQLVRSDSSRVIVPSPTTVASLDIHDAEAIQIRVADQADLGASHASNSHLPSDLALVKVYRSDGTMAVAFWVSRYTPVTMASIYYKYWRCEFKRLGNLVVRDLQAWTDMQEAGDGTSAGWPCQDSTARLSSFLNRNHCFGNLANEGVYREPQREYCPTLVLKVQMSSPYRKDKRVVLSRLDVLKQMFEALINRLLAYNYKTHVGLVTVASEASLKMPVSHVIENFRRATNGMAASGDTALFDALALACDQLNQYASAYPNAKKRIICISDGEDTKSTSHTAEGVTWNMLQHNIALDSICRGEETGGELHAISHALGCYKLEPTSLVNALAICELEPFLALTDRPSLVVKMPASISRSAFRTCFLSMPFEILPTVVTEHQIPKRKNHPNQNDSFIPLADAARRPARASTSVTPGARSNLRTTRLLTEMRQIAPEVLVRTTTCMFPRQT